MNQLSLITQAVRTMSSPEIAELTGKGLGHVNRDIRDMLADLKDDPDLDHQFREDKDARGYTAAYHLNRELTDTLLTGYSIPLRRKVIARWHELEGGKVVAPVAALPGDYIEALEALLMTKKSEQRALAQVKQQQAALSLAAPKAKALDRLTLADGAMCITNAAKSLGVQPKHLFSWMQENDWIYRRPGSAAWVAYQQRLKTGVLDHKVTTVEKQDGSEKIVAQVLVTAKGLTRLAELVGEVMA